MRLACFKIGYTPRALGTPYKLLRVILGMPRDIVDFRFVLVGDIST